MTERYREELRKFSICTRSLYKYPHTCLFVGWRVRGNQGIGIRISIALDDVRGNQGISIGIGIALENVRRRVCEEKTALAM
jgi:hypothetical protein